MRTSPCSSITSSRCPLPVTPSPMPCTGRSVGPSGAGSPIAGPIRLSSASCRGGLEADLRRESAERLREIGFDGYAVGGLSVGEGPEAMVGTLVATVPHLPSELPRYLMGVGQPRDIVAAVTAGIDMFDCVLPTRCGRNSLAYTFDGQVRLRNARHARDPRPLEDDCPCIACHHGRGYLRHLFLAGEMLGPILVSIHNLTFYQRLVSRLRDGIVSGRFEGVCRGILDRLANDPEPAA